MRLRVAALLLATSPLAACSSSGSGLEKRAATDGGNGAVSGASGAMGASGSAGTSGSGGAATGGHGGAGGSLTDVPCGAAVCKPLADKSVESFACCTDKTTCGYRLPLSTKCLATNQIGTVNPVCAPFELQGKVAFPGCCSPKGCGARVTIGGIGCVENGDLYLPHVACVFDTIDSGPAVTDAAAKGDAP